MKGQRGRRQKKSVAKRRISKLDKGRHTEEEEGERIREADRRREGRQKSGGQTKGKGS